MWTLDCLIVSTGRAASTAVYRYLDQLGGLDLPANKEPHYWCNVHAYQGIYPLLEDLLVDSWADYQALYRGSRLSIDASVGYFFTAHEVIENLRAAHQKPKVVFLYREPISRAASLYNEVSRKELCDGLDFLTSLATVRDDGLWWEYYFDNVHYADVFNMLAREFSPLIAINYDRFRENPAHIMTTLCEFLGIEGHASIVYEPVNSSAEAILRKRASKLKPVAAVLPGGIKRRAIEILRRFQHVEVPERDQVEPYLQDSIAQYQEFRDLIQHEDIYLG